MSVRAAMLLLVGTVVLGIASSAAAQGASWRIVHASDGTVYVLKDGARYAIVGEEISDDELAAYEDGEPIGSGLLLNAIAPSAQPAGGSVAPGEAQAVPPAVEGGAALGTDPNGAAQPADPNAAAQPGAPLRSAVGKAKPSPVGVTPVPQAPTSDLQFVSVLGNTPGQAVTVTVQAREGAACSIEYFSPTRAKSSAAGLGPQTVGASRTATWTFVLDAAIKSGNGTVAVTCDQATISRALVIGGLSK